MNTNEWWIATLVKQHICKSEIYKQSQNISLYLSMPTGELNTDDLARQVIVDGKKVLDWLMKLNLKTVHLIGKKLFIPFIQPSVMPTMRMVNISTVEELNNLGRNKWGIPEPSPFQIDKYEDGNYKNYLWNIITLKTI